MIAVGQAHDAHAADRALEWRASCAISGLALPAAEEHHVDAAPVMLVDQHADVLAAFERAREADRRIEAGRDQGAHAARAHLDDGVADARRCWAADRADARRSCRLRRRAPAPPSWRDARRRRASACRVADRHEARSADWSSYDESAGPGRSSRGSSMRSRCANSAPTRPRLSQTPRGSSRSPAGDLSGKAATRLSRPTRCSGSHGPTCASAPEQPFAMRLRSVWRSSAQQRDRDPSDGGIDHRLRRRRTVRRSVAAELASDGAFALRTSRRSCRTPAGFRAAPARARNRRAALRCRSPASMPAAILARLSRTLRIEPPNEPMMRYCCRNSWIRLIWSIAPRSSRRSPAGRRA